MAQITPYQKDILSLFHQGNFLASLNTGNILVAGATGLIGSCIIDILMANPDKGYHVYAAGRNRKRAQNKFSLYWEDEHFAFIEMDVTQPLQGDITFDYIIDAASNASPNFFKTSPVEVILSNINGVSHLANYGKNHGLQRMVYISSGEIYGEGNGQEFSEKDSGYVDCASLRACYPSSKRAAETLCMAYAEEYHIDIVIARLCHTYGPGFTESDNRVYAQFIRNVLQNEDIVLKSKGQQYRSWLYVIDAAHAILQLLLKGKNKNAYNVANENSNITIRQLAELIAESTGHRVIFDIPNDALQGNTTPITKASFNTSKIQAIGWKPLFNIKEGINHTIESVKKV